MSATKPTEREKQLEADFNAAVELRDTYQQAWKEAEAERDEAQAQVKQLTSELQATTTDLTQAREYRQRVDSQLLDVRAALAAATGPAPEQTAGPEASTEPTDADPHAGTRALLKRMGLKRAYILNGELCFDENHAKFTAGPDFENLEVIKAAE